MRVYLDVCCLNRPFDDQSQPRIRLEAEAVVEILNRCEREGWEQVASEVTRIEVLAITDDDRRRKVLRLLPRPEDLVSLDREVAFRAQRLVALGFKPADALHVAAAEKAGAGVFLSCDDRLCGLAARCKRVLKGTGRESFGLAGGADLT